MPKVGLDHFEIRSVTRAPTPRWFGLARPQRAAFHAQVLINGVEATPECVAVGVLLEGALADGTFFPFVCSCGDAGCAGNLRGIHLIHAGGETLWTDQDNGRCYVFATEDLRVEVDKLRRAIGDARARWPDVALEVWDSAFA